MRQVKPSRRRGIVNKISLFIALCLCLASLALGTPVPARAQYGITINDTSGTGETFVAYGDTITLHLTDASCCSPGRTWAAGSLVVDGGARVNLVYVSSTGNPAPSSGTGGLTPWYGDTLDSYNGAHSGEDFSFTWPPSIEGFQSVGAWSDTHPSEVVYRVFPYSDATLTPSASPTATVTPTATFAAGGLFPTNDTRPRCTLTPTASPTNRTATATRRSMMDITRTIPAGTYTPLPTSTREIVYTPVPTFTATNTRVPGDCSLPHPLEVADYGADVDFTDYLRDEEGEIVEDCITLIPHIQIGPLGSTIRDIINSIVDGDPVTEENTTLLIESAGICTKYRKISLKFVGVDFTPWVAIILGVVTVFAVLEVFRKE